MNATEEQLIIALPGCVSQGEAPLQGDATVHLELPEQQRREVEQLSRGAAGRHRWGSTGRARQLRVGLHGLRAADGEGSSLLRVFPGSLGHVAA